MDSRAGSSRRLFATHEAPLVIDHELQWVVDVGLYIVATHMQVDVLGALVAQALDQPGDGLLVVAGDDPVQVSMQDPAGSQAPPTEQSALEPFLPPWLAREGIVPQVEHADRS